MREISDGLGSGVTPDQLEAAVDLGDEWLEEIRKYDFSQQRRLARGMEQASLDLVNQVKEFSSPVESLKANVSDVNAEILELTNKLDDLKNNSDRTMDMVSGNGNGMRIQTLASVTAFQIREANAMNFRNSDPPAEVKAGRILSVLEATENNNSLGSELVNEADDFLRDARNYFDRAASLRDSMTINTEDMSGVVDQYGNDIDTNRQQLQAASDSVRDLEESAQRFDAILARSKAPGTRTLDAANAYETIVNAVDNARESADQGWRAAEEAENMVRDML